MADFRPGNFQSCCRLCLCEELDNLKSVFDETTKDRSLPQKILQFVAVEITTTDKLTTMVCNQCVSKVNYWHDYKQTCANNQKRLEQWLSSCPTTNIADMSLQIKEEPMGDTDDSSREEPENGIVEVLVKNEPIDHPDDPMEEEYNELPPPLTPHPPDLHQDSENSQDGSAPDIEEAAVSVVSSHLPERSRANYEKAYERFSEWCDENNIDNGINEKVLLTYFEHLSTFRKCSSLWAYYSMLRTTISVKRNVDISKYSTLLTFLKGKSQGYKPKKSRILTKQDIAKFLQEADDKKFLLTKVALIIGIAGACRKEELTNLLVKNVKDEGRLFHIVIPNTKNNTFREFFVTSGGMDGLNMVEIVRKYLAQRPGHADHGRFFVGYRNGKCIKQPVGINTFGGMPKKIAAFLKLPTPEEYTGRCFRRSSKSLLADF